jgi:hypothetical protein
MCWSEHSAAPAGTLPGARRYLWQIAARFPAGLVLQNTQGKGTGNAAPIHPPSVGIEGQLLYTLALAQFHDTL